MSLANAKELPISEADKTTINDLLMPISQDGMRVLEWAEKHRTSINAQLEAKGAVLLRGLKVMSSRQFGQLLTVLFEEDLANYSYRSTPRTELRGNVYTATEYHSSAVIPQHNENSYTNKWAMRIGFFCLMPSEVGGETPIASSRRVYREIDQSVKDEFERRGVMYVRNYGSIDVPWKEVFQTDSPAVVEQFCNDNGIQWEWLDNDGLRTRQIRPACADHPVTGDRVWFNQAHLFHISNVEKEVRESLLAVTDESDLPRNTYFGDGSPIPLEYLEHVRQVYRDNEIVFSWQQHDILLLDNMLFSHGRKPFEGQRKVLVGMADIHGVD